MPVIFQSTQQPEQTEVQEEINVAVLAPTQRQAMDILKVTNIRPNRTYVYIYGLQDLRSRIYLEVIEHYTAKEDKRKHELIVDHIRRHLRPTTQIYLYSPLEVLIQTSELTNKYLLNQ